MEVIADKHRIAKYMMIFLTIKILRTIICHLSSFDQEPGYPIMFPEITSLGKTMDFLF